MEDKQPTQKIFHSSSLRKGRYSCSGNRYLVTTVTSNRDYYFHDFSIARTLIGCLKEAQSKGLAFTNAFVVMPDHLHWIFELGQEKDLSATVAYIKGLSTIKIRRNGTSRFSWQPGFHDHCFRNNENYISAMRYVIANPLRAGIVEKIGDYPHWDCAYIP